MYDTLYAILNNSENATLPYFIFCKKALDEIEDIYFFEVNTKYISSSAVKKISIFHECVARVKMQIFSPHEMKYILYLP